MRELLFVLSAVAVVAALEGALHLWRWRVEQRAQELRRRLQSVGAVVPGSGAGLLREERYARSRALDELLRALPVARRLHRLLEQTDSRMSVAQVCGASVLAALAGVTVASVLRLGLPLAILLAALGAALPTLLLLAGRERRSQRLSEQLPEALDMMARSLRAGHALTSSFEVVASEMPEPVAVEFGRAFEAQRLGLPAEQAIVQMTERAPGNRDLKIFAVSALIQRETGGNLAEILSNISETIRARYKFYGKLRALTAEGRASAFVLGFLPIGMVILLRFVSPDYLVPLVTTPLGKGILLYALLSWVFGVLWLWRLTKVDV